MKVLNITCLILCLAVCAYAVSLKVTWRPAAGASSYIIHYTTPSGSGWHTKARGQVAIEGMESYEGTMEVSTTFGLISISTTHYGPYMIYVKAKNTIGISRASDLVAIYYTGR
jgi:hypothetical protein